MSRISNEDLMQRVLDGEATPQEAARLQAALAADAGARARYDELERLFGILQSVCAVEPPPGSEAEAIQRLRERGALDSRRDLRGGWWSASLRAIGQHARPSLAYAFAAGVVAGVALLGALDGKLRPGLDGGSQGAMLTPGRFDGAGVVDMVELTAGGCRAVVRTRALGRSILTEVECACSDRATLVLEFDSSALSVVGFEQGATQAAVAIEPGRMHIDHRGENRYRILFEQDGAVVSGLRVAITSSGATVEKVVRTGAGVR